MTCKTQIPSVALLLIIGILALSAQPAAAQRPSKAILENDVARVVLRKEAPAVLEYELKATHRILSANISGASPQISFYKGSNPVYRLQTKVTYSTTTSATAVIYHTQVTYQEQIAITFDLVYRLNGNQLSITLHHIDEHADFYLFSVSLPELMSVKAGDDVARLVIPADAGRLIDVSSASIDSYEYEIDWRNPILTGFAYRSGIIGILDSKSIENHTVVNVSERRGIKYGTFSTVLMHRLKGYDLYEFGTVIPAKDPRYYLKVQDSCNLTVTVGGDYDKDGRVDWVDGAKMVRKDIQAVPNPFYKDQTFVRAFLSRKGGTQENISFDSILHRIQQFAARTDSAPYVVYLLGWQYRGHDSGYPSTDSVNHSLGGYSALVHLITEARKYHVTVTFYDNFDDAYPTHPGWDPDVICRDPEGNLMKGGAWDGEQSYLISSYKYAVKSGLTRIRSVLKRFPIRDAYFIDVLAGGYNGGRKYDFDPESPAGAIKNFEGKQMLLREFNQRGIDVATEDFTGYFVGHVGTFGDIIAFDKTYFHGEQAIPLIPFIYHGKTSFGMKTSSTHEYARTFLYGQRAQKFTNLRTLYTPADYIVDALPKQKLYGKIMDRYTRIGDVQTITYDDGTQVEVNVTQNTYRVALTNGQVIAKDYTAFVPVGQDKYMACSQLGGKIDYALPKGWDNPAKIHVIKINVDGTQDAEPFDVLGNRLQFSAIARMPYQVIYK
jgi:hypothetical protein